MTLVLATPNYRKVCPWQITSASWVRILTVHQELSADSENDDQTHVLLLYALLQRRGTTERPSCPTAEHTWTAYTGASGRLYREILYRETQPVMVNILGRLALGYCSWGTHRGHVRPGIAYIEPFFAEDRRGLLELVASASGLETGMSTASVVDCTDVPLVPYLRGRVFQFAIFPFQRVNGWRYPISEYRDRRLGAEELSHEALRSCDCVSVDFRVVRKSVGGRVMVALIVAHMIRLSPK